MTVIDDAVIRSSGARLLALFADFCELNPPFFFFLACAIKGTGSKEPVAPPTSQCISEVLYFVLIAAIYQVRSHISPVRLGRNQRERGLSQT